MCTVNLLAALLECVCSIGVFVDRHSWRSWYQENKSNCDAHVIVFY